MICGHCNATAVDVKHVRLCSRTPGGPLYELHPVTEDGMYRLGDVIYKVQTSPTSGHRYAKRLVVESESGEPEITKDAEVHFEYAPGAVLKLHAEDRLSLEDAKAFGALYGTCCVCGRTLTNTISIEAGIGPVCGGRL